MAVELDAPSQAPVGHSRSYLAIFLAAVGNLIEWFDWYVYSALALYFAPAFFPSKSPTAQLLDAAAVFAVGFLVRPLGGWLLGAYADIHGRKAALTLSILLMSGGSLMIALTPNYDSVGVVAPAILVVARLLQGLSVGGEYGASATYLAEAAPDQSRGFISSFQAVTGILGQLLALGMLVTLQFVFLTPAQLRDWGWRIPFVMGGAGALLIFVLRRRLPETALFDEVADRVRQSPLSALIKHWRAVLSAGGLTLGGIVAYYTYTAYAQKFLANTAGFSKEMATAISAGTLLLYTPLQPLFGALSDRIGRRPLLLMFGVLGTLFTVPIMTAVSRTTNPIAAFAWIMLALVIVSGYTAINSVVKAELFPTEVRAIGVALPYALCVSVFGGTAEFIALSLKNAGHEEWFYWYVSACVFISLISYLCTPDTRGRNLAD
jgi:MHS family alpha-ketoglutarate permease-like MFS transporter